MSLPYYVKLAFFFLIDYFTQTGNDEWYQFVQAAKELATAETKRGEREPYPQEGDQCLLCYQALSNEALDLIRRLWKFLEDDIMERLRQAENLLKQYKTGFQAVSTDFFDEQSVYYRYVQDLNPTLLPVIHDFLGGCSNRKNKATGGNLGTPFSFPVSKGIGWLQTVMILTKSPPRFVI